MPGNNKVAAMEMGEIDQESNKSGTLDDMIDQIASNRRPLFIFVVLSMMAWWLGNPMIIYSPSFSGEMPSTWKCVSEECKTLQTEWKTDTEQLFPCADTAGRIERFGRWESGADYIWIPKSNRSSFAIDLDLVCQPFQVDLVSSIFFIGALTGLLVGSVTYDQFGRKRSALFGSILVVTTSLIGMFCKNYIFLLAIRFIQGLGAFLAGTGMYIISVEILPAQYRNLVNGWAMNLWAVGNSILALAAYLVQDWNDLFLTMAIFMAVVAIPQIYAPESPRYHMLQGDQDSAEEVLKKLAYYNGVTLPKMGDLQRGDSSSNLLTQLRDLIRHPTLLLETLGQMYLWFFVGMAYYAFNFGWGSIIPDPYLGYITAMIGEITAYTLFIPVVSRLGRRFSMVTMFILAAIAVFTALCQTTVSGDWTVGSISCLLGIVFVSAAFSGVYLWSSELAPSSHRGLVFSMCSVISRVGGFFGPMMFNALAKAAGPAVPIIIIGTMSCIAAVVSWLLVETSTTAIAETPADITTRRAKNWKMF
eukprot:sb/3463779/